MKKVQFFAGTDIQKLQNEINDWLANNRDAGIIATNLNTVATPGAPPGPAENHVFYILYTTANMEANELVEMLEQSSATVEDITQDIAQGTMEKPQLSNTLTVGN